MNTNDVVDWEELMRQGLGALRLAPDVFWSMTPRELILALEGAGLKPIGTARKMDRATLDDLMQQYPDIGRSVDKGDSNGHP